MGIDWSPVCFWEGTSFWCRVPNLVGSPAWNGDFAHATNCLKRFSTMCVSTTASAKRMRRPMNMEMF